MKRLLGLAFGLLLAAAASAHTPLTESAPAADASVPAPKEPHAMASAAGAATNGSVRAPRPNGVTPLICSDASASYRSKGYARRRSTGL